MQKDVIDPLATWTKMAQPAASSKAHDLKRAWRVLSFAAGLMLAGWCSVGTVRAEEIGVSAKIDKTTTDVLNPVTLTITLSGDLEGLKLPTPTLPQEFAVAGQSQSTNFSMQAGVVERSMSLSFVLIPQKAGTFKLGPFTVEHHKKEFQTVPIEITVKKSALPPKLQPQGERFTL